MTHFCLSDAHRMPLSSHIPSALSAFLRTKDFLPPFLPQALVTFCSHRSVLHASTAQTLMIHPRRADLSKWQMETIKWIVHLLGYSSGLAGDILYHVSEVPEVTQFFTHPVLTSFPSLCYCHPYHCFVGLSPKGTQICVSGSAST